MDAVRTQGKGQVATVIHEKEDLQLPRSVPERKGLAKGFFHRGRLIAILEDRDTGAGGSVQHVNERAMGPRRRVENDV
jgi:hypothetical protein